MSLPTTPAAPVQTAQALDDLRIVVETMKLRVRNVDDHQAFVISMLGRAFSEFNDRQKAATLQFLSACTELRDSLQEFVDHPRSLASGATVPPYIPVDVLTAAASLSLN